MTKKILISKSFKILLALTLLGGLIAWGFWAENVKGYHADQFKGAGFAYGAINDNGNNEDIAGADTGIGYLSFGCEGDGGESWYQHPRTNMLIFKINIRL